MTKQQTLSGDWVEVVEAPRANVTVTKKELKNWYLDQERSVKSIANELDTSPTTARRLIKKANVEFRDPSEGSKIHVQALRDERDYIDKDLLQRLHHEEGLSVTEMGEEFDVTGSTISYWLQKFDIEIKPSGYEIPEFCLSYNFSTSGKDGYPLWKGCDGQYVLVHRLVLVANGADPHDVYANPEKNTHHRNGHKADNRPSNLELVNRSAHGRRHSSAGNYSRKWTDDDLEAAIKMILNPSRINLDETEETGI